MSDSDLVEYFSVNESFNSSPKKPLDSKQLQATEISMENTEKVDDSLDVTLKSEKPLEAEVKTEKQTDMKRTQNFDDDDDFFVIGSISKKKKKSKKHKKHKKIDALPTLEDIAPTIEQEDIHTEDGPSLENVEVIEESPTIKLKSTSAAPAPKLGSITPPPIIDKSLFETRVSPRKLRNKLKQQKREQQDFLDIISSLDEEPELVEEIIPKNPDVYEFDDIYEKSRSYIIRVISKLPDTYGEPKDMVLDFSAKGIKKFSRIFDVVLTYFKSTYANDPTFLPELYSKDKVKFVWLEGKTEIRPFYKPSTLRIPPAIPMSLIKENVEIPISNITLLLIPEKHSKTYTKIYPEFNKNSIGDSSQLSREIEQLEAKAKLDMTDDSLEILDDEEDNTLVSEPVSQLSQEKVEDVDEYFVVGLKGSDNKRIEVQVSPSTQIIKMLHFYLKKKDIAPSSVNMKKVKLIFDDEPLDLNGVVGDTELEEEFEVQVVL